MKYILIIYMVLDVMLGTNFTPASAIDKTACYGNLVFEHYVASGMWGQTLKTCTNDDKPKTAAEIREEELSRMRHD